MTDRRTIFGVDSVTPYDIKTGKPFSDKPFKVLGSFALNISQEAIPLNGGSSFDAQDIELGVRTIESSMIIREFPSALVEIALGKKPTENAAEPGGSVTPLKNVKGVSVLDATTGIVSVGVESGSEIDVPFAGYVVVAVSPTTVDVFAYSDIDFAQGIDKSFEDGSLQKITATPLTITMGDPVTIPNFGIELTGGSGTIALIVGDSAVFESRPINTFSRDVNIGGENDRNKFIGIIAHAQRKSNGEMYRFNIYQALLTGLPFVLTEKTWVEAEVTINPKRAIDIFTGKTGLFSFRHVISSNNC